MAHDVTHVIRAKLAESQGVDPERPGGRAPVDYGVAASLDGDLLDLTLTFLRDHANCCMEWSCHLGSLTGRDWSKWRDALIRAGIEPPEALRLHLHVVVEEGALFFDFSKPHPTIRGWYDFAPSKAHAYELSLPEPPLE